MRLFLMAGLMILTMATQSAIAQTGVGLTVGGPTYIHLTRYLNTQQAVNVGASFSYNSATHIYTDYLIKTFEPLNKAQLSDIGFYYGVGGEIVISNKDRRNNDAYYGDRSGDLGLGVRVPLGFEWRPPQTQNFHYHLQLVPTLAVVPETEIEFTAGIGLKYFFK